MDRTAALRFVLQHARETAAADDPNLYPTPCRHCEGEARLPDEPVPVEGYESLFPHVQRSGTPIQEHEPNCPLAEAITVLEAEPEQAALRAALKGLLEATAPRAGYWTPDREVLERARARAIACLGRE